MCFCACSVLNVCRVERYSARIQEVVVRLFRARENVHVWRKTQTLVVTSRHECVSRIVEERERGGHRVSVCIFAASSCKIVRKSRRSSQKPLVEPFGAVFNLLLSQSRRSKPCRHSPVGSNERRRVERVRDDISAPRANDACDNL